MRTTNCVECVDMQYQAFCSPSLYYWLRYTHTHTHTEQQQRACPLGYRTKHNRRSSKIQGTALGKCLRLELNMVLNTETIRLIRDGEKVW